VTAIDPRPRWSKTHDGWRLEGARCTSCGHVTVEAAAWCARCYGAVESGSFGPDGAVWAATVVRIPLPGREPPYALAYVDLDDGPRLLAHVMGSAAPRAGTRVRLAGPSAAGDPQVEVLP
jgi:uncharacterized protein